MDRIELYPGVWLYRRMDGSFAYTDTYGELHEFDSPDSIWDHLTEDGEDFSDSVQDFIYQAD